MTINVFNGDIHISSVQVRRHSQGIFTIQISTPLEKHCNIQYGSHLIQSENLIVPAPYPSRQVAQFVDLYPARPGIYGLNATRVSFSAETNEEEEALNEGLFELDAWSRWSVLLVAVPNGFFDEYEDSGSWVSPF
jgi:hypothetical protein